MRIAKIKFLCW